MEAGFQVDGFQGRFSEGAVFVRRLFSRGDGFPIAGGGSGVDEVSVWQVSGGDEVFRWQV